MFWGVVGSRSGWTLSHPTRGQLLLLYQAKLAQPRFLPGSRWSLSEEGLIVHHPCSKLEKMEMPPTQTWRPEAESTAAESTTVPRSQ